MAYTGGGAGMWEESPKSLMPSASEASQPAGKLWELFRRLLVGQQVVGPLLIGDHVVGVIGRRVLGRVVGSDAGRDGGDRPIDVGVAEEVQRIALAAAAVDGAVRRRQEAIVGPAQQQLAAVDDEGVGDRGRV